MYLYPRLYRKLKAPVIDIGCGIGDFLAYRSDAIGLDIDLESISYCQQNGRTAYQFDGVNLPFDDNSVCSVVLDNVLEHIKEPTPLLTDISRVIQLSGTFVVGVPGAKGYSSDSDHKVYYDEKSLIARIEQHHFKTLKIIYAPVKSEFLNKSAKQYCLYAYFYRV